MTLGNTPSEKMVRVAVIVGAHGIKGEVKLRLLVSDEKFFDTPTNTFTRTGAPLFTVHTTGRTGDTRIARISTVSDRNTAEPLKGTELFAPESTLPAIGEDEFYYDDLIGLEARLADGTAFGCVAAVNNFGAGDILEITLPGGGSELLPFQAPWVGEVLPEQGYLIITLPEYIEADRP